MFGGILLKGLALIICGVILLGMTGCTKEDDTKEVSETAIVVSEDVKDDNLSKYLKYLDYNKDGYNWYTVTKVAYESGKSTCEKLGLEFAEADGEEAMNYAIEDTLKYADYVPLLKSIGVLKIDSVNRGDVEYFYTCEERSGNWGDIGLSGLNGELDTRFINLSEYMTVKVPYRTIIWELDNEKLVPVWVVHSDKPFEDTELLFNEFGVDISLYYEATSGSIRFWGMYKNEEQYGWYANDADGEFAIDMVTGMTDGTTYEKRQITNLSEGLGYSLNTYYIKGQNPITLNKDNIIKELREGLFLKEIKNNF